MRRATGYLMGVVVAGALAAVGLALRFGPAASLATALALPAAEPPLARLTGEPRVDTVRIPGKGAALEADLYQPPHPRGALVLVHGLSPAGRRQPDLARLARLLARHGQMVLVPNFEGLRAFRLGDEVAEIERSLRYLGGYGHPVGIAGFSFGAGPALLAAAGVPHLRLVGSFGGYADLRHVVAYVTTGVHTFAGRRYVQAPEEYNRWKLLALLAPFVEDRRDRARLEALARRKLASPAEDTTALAAQVGEQGRRILAVIDNRRDDQVAVLLARLPPAARRSLARLSPLPVVPRLEGRLLLAHGARDASIPFTESLRLAEASGGRARAVVFRTFEHVGPAPLWQSLRDRALDGWELTGLADALLAR